MKWEMKQAMFCTGVLMMGVIQVLFSMGLISGVLTLKDVPAQYSLWSSAVLWMIFLIYGWFALAENIANIAPVVIVTLIGAMPILCALVHIPILWEIGNMANGFLWYAILHVVYRKILAI
ncbi:MAG: hypothetical protein UY31_C0020G0012 [Candidatus Wolfebacteria bacterium GW2011_GWE1_48_7]|uniref:Uncharacterized protein n=2 Tax=Candidatus Wolfeibacteriota TaxID=1752735 RepID=A0A0G1U5R9_9BACT|nr:MAG: hypothetical protein UX70_C0001G0652 [Candidatus Wolfebacteria bacterium GW2011_GWB1_47_1]KKU42424.1 MAG: hypothetical protein UX58_C0002G0138 [Candidatus Wolfebacteria bacterium GW2011_GWB2_46_69]KKU54208.1 MAG: hypothetical protein UX76_C0004G0012 [Candidatus Wolfebacteria bacterium GW2011_GWC1_47_103]KKU58700.1 MAG: hypothetical protein UX83_C0013G0010 [Candidatus Wolfebacteria bacterium GW2011_GWE2_47_12]KKU66221.1 MAG: hypothetical protein UX90_C0001G0280 [Candidatus Wolfebacteria 